MRTRRATLPDASAIQELIAMHADDGTLLPRSLPEICENIRDFVVIVDDQRRIVGCGALHLYGTHLAEVRSIAVRAEARGRGAGARVVQGLLTESRRQHVAGVCLFTRIPDYFAKLGFTVVPLSDLPDKI